MTLPVRSERGTAYLYDDVTGSILPWTDTREQILSQISRGLSPDAVAAPVGLRRSLDADVAFVRRWFTTHGAFYRTLAPLPPPSAAELDALIAATTSQLILTVTDQCNLRCRHCIFSGAYLHVRTHGTAKMPSETAIAAVEWYAQLLQRAPGSLRTVGLTFWGGEPLLNFRLITQVLRHAEASHPGLFRPNLTTNGVLLTPAVVRALVAHGVQIAVSIDGPTAEHDRRRVFKDGKGTLAVVLRNLQWIRNQYPEYWRDRMTAVVVHDHDTDLVAARDFFRDPSHAVPRVATVQTVLTKALKTPEPALEMSEQRRSQLQALKLELDMARASRLQVDGYLDALFGQDLTSVAVRQRLCDPRPACLPHGGTCLPGYRLAVRLDGTIDLCERVNATMPIGHLPEGLHIERIANLITSFQSTVLVHCQRCPISKLCGACFAQLAGDGRFEHCPDACARRIRVAQDRVTRHVTLMERGGLAPEFLLG